MLSVACVLALCSLPVRCAIRKKAVDHFISLISADASEQKYFIGKEVSSHDYDFRKTAYAVGGKNGTRFYYVMTNSQISNNVPSNRYTADVRSHESGFVVGFRMEDCRRHAFTFGRASKTVELKPFTKYIVSGTCRPCILPIPAKADETSDSYFISDMFQVIPSLKLGLTLEREKMKLLTRFNSSIETKIITLSLGHEWKSGNVVASFSRYKTNRSLDNSHIALGFEQGIWKHFKVFADAGIYTDGLPTGSGPFSDLGDRFVFDFLGGDSDFNRLYTGKFGYYSFGLNFSVPLK